MDRACVGYSSAHRPVMNTVAGTFRRRSSAISSGLSKCSPAAARGPSSAVMSASKVSATTLSVVFRARLKTGVSPARSGAIVGGWFSAGVGFTDGDGGGVADCACRGAWVTCEPALFDKVSAPQPIRTVLRVTLKVATAVNFRTELVTYGK